MILLNDSLVTPSGCWLSFVKIFRYLCCIFPHRSHGVPWFFLLSKECLCKWEVIPNKSRFQAHGWWCWAEHLTGWNDFRFRHYADLLFQTTLHRPFFVVDIKLVFSSFKIVNKLVWKTLSLVGPVRVWFTSFYVGETPQHLPTRVHEHLVSNGTSHIFRHLQNSQLCRTLCSDECFGILDHASTTF